MITNKDLSINSKNGQVILNGDKYDLGTQGEMDAAVKDVYSVMGKMGAKNLIPYPYNESDHTESGITWTVNSDGSVTANGTATANSTFIFRQRTEQTKFVAKNTSYILSGCPSGGSKSKYMLYLFVQTQESTNITSGIDYGYLVTNNGDIYSLTPSGNTTFLTNIGDGTIIETPSNYCNGSWDLFIIKYANESTFDIQSTLYTTKNTFT